MKLYKNGLDTEMQIENILKGEKKQVEYDYAEFLKIKVDEKLLNKDNFSSLKGNQTTIISPVEVSGSGTFNVKKIRKLRFCPVDNSGWWFKRTDLSHAKPIKVDICNAWTENYGGVNNIVLGEKGSENIIRLTEHIIALKTFMGIDNLLIETDSYDPPLFEQGSLDIVTALHNAEKKELKELRKFYKVREEVVMGWQDRGFLRLVPPKDDAYKKLELDCAINYPDNIMGTERIQLTVDDKIPLKGVVARTNSSIAHAILSKTIGKLFPTVRNLGYNARNVLIVGKNKYYNEPRLPKKGKSLEPIWHRAVLDLLAAVALISDGYLVGELTSYKPGHTQDIEFIRELFDRNMLLEMQ